MKTTLRFLISAISIFLYGASNIHAQCPITRLATPFIYEYTFGKSSIGWEVSPINTDGDGLADDGVVIAGETFVDGQSLRQAIVIRLNPDGTPYTGWVTGADHGYKTFGGDFGNDVVYSVTQASDGNLLVCGTKFSNKFSSGGNTYNHNAWFFKLDIDDGTLIGSEHEYGGNGEDNAYDVTEDVQNGYYVIAGGAGNEATDDLTQFYPTNHDCTIGQSQFWVFRINTNNYSINNSLNEIYPGSYQINNGMYSSQDIARSIIVDYQGKYVVTGFCGSCENTPNRTQQLKLVKINPSDLSHPDEFTYGVAGSDQGGHDVVQTYDGTYGTHASTDGYFAAGITHPKDNDCNGLSSPNKHDLYVLRAQNNGNPAWSAGCVANDPGKNFGGNYEEDAYSCVQTPDGGFLMAGITYSGSNDYDVTCNAAGANANISDIWILKLNSSGVREWDQSLGNVFGYDKSEDEAHHIIRIPDGSYVLSGQVATAISNIQLYVVNFALPCDVPGGEYTDELMKTSAKTHWNNTNSASKYKVRYRVTGNNTWATISATNNYKKITGLTCNTQYDWEVRSVCTDLGLGNSDWSSLQNFTTSACRLSEVDEPVYSKVEVFPNPFSTSTTISFSLAKNALVDLNLLDVTGKGNSIYLHRIFRTRDKNI